MVRRRLPVSNRFSRNGHILVTSPDPSDGSCVFFDPTVERCMINRDAALSHNLLKIAIRGAKPDVEVLRVQNDSLRTMGTFETDQTFNSARRSAKRIFWNCLHPNAITSAKVCATTVGKTINNR